jgi:hypothetical protein
MDCKNTAIIILGLSGLMFSCANKQGDGYDFYSKPHVESDVSRLPIYKPYELVTAYCCSDWHIGRLSNKWSHFDLEVDIDSIGYDNETIYIFDSNQEYFALNLSDSTKIQFNSVMEFYNSQKVKLYEVESAYNYYQKYGLPPWIIRSR